MKILHLAKNRALVPLIIKTKVKEVISIGHRTIFPDIILIESLYVNNRDVNIGYVSAGQALLNYAYVPLDFEFDVPSKEEIVEFSKKTLKNVLDHKFMIGSDPEIFVEDKDGVVIPAFTFLGSKKKPTKCELGNTAYWDGFQAEFTTNPGGCLDYQREEMGGALKTILDSAQEKFPGAKLSSKTVLDIPHGMLQTGKDEHVQFGCSPSLNAYELFGQKEDGRTVPFRPAGGHMHFGIANLEKEDYIRIVKALDAIIGVACVSLFAKFDDPRRRQLYGLPGEYRLPKHGLEYRVLSNAWLFHPLITNIVWDLARKVVRVGQLNLLDSLWKHDEKETIRIITECDVKAAREVLSRNRAMMIKLIAAAHYNHPEAAYGVWRFGMEKAVKNPHDVAGNWDLGNSEDRNDSGHSTQWEECADDVKAKRKIA